MGVVLHDVLNDLRSSLLDLEPTEFELFESGFEIFKTCQYIPFNFWIYHPYIKVLHIKCETLDLPNLTE